MLLHTMRSLPELFKSKLGIDANRLAIRKVKGTHWDSVLFAKSMDPKHQKELDDFRKLDAEFKLERQRQADLEFEQREAKSVVFIEQAKMEKLSCEPNF